MTVPDVVQHRVRRKSLEEKHVEERMYRQVMLSHLTLPKTKAEPELNRKPTDMDIVKHRLDNLLYQVKYMADAERDNSASKRIANQWKFAAYVFDRLCGVALIFILAAVFIYMCIEALVYGD